MIKYKYIKIKYKYIKINNLKEWDFTLYSLHRKGYRWSSKEDLSKEKHHEYFLKEKPIYIGFSEDHSVGVGYAGYEIEIYNRDKIIPNPFIPEEELE